MRIAQRSNDFLSPPHIESFPDKKPDLLCTQVEVIFLVFEIPEYGRGIDSEVHFLKIITQGSPGYQLCCRLGLDTPRTVRSLNGYLLDPKSGDQ